MNKQDQKDELQRLRTQLIERGFKPHVSFPKSEAWSYRKINYTLGGHHDIMVTHHKYVASVVTDVDGNIKSDLSVELNSPADMDFMLAQF